VVGFWVQHEMGVLEKCTRNTVFTKIAKNQDTQSCQDTAVAIISEPRLATKWARGLGAPKGSAYMENAYHWHAVRVIASGITTNF